MCDQENLKMIWNWRNFIRPRLLIIFCVPWLFHGQAENFFCLKKKKKSQWRCLLCELSHPCFSKLRWILSSLFLYCSSCRYKQRNIINVFENMVHVCVLFLCTISSSLIYSASFKKHVCDVKISNWQKNIFCTKTFFLYYCSKFLKVKLVNFCTVNIISNLFAESS